ncbi:MAG: DUF4920 domain-containing protein [Bacteroidota bacterium]
MRIFLFAIVALAMTFTACGPQQVSEADAPAAATEAADGTAVAGKLFGAAFEPQDIIAYPDLEQHVTGEDSVAVTVRGTVDGVCQKKGCWMTMVDASGEGMFVRFKDYGFFVPVDISGREVVMNGKAFYQITPVDELRHYAEDEGLPQAEIDAITEPKKELRFYADGVILVEDDTPEGE